MSPLQSLYKEIDSLFQQMESLKPFKKTDDDRLWKKFRLEWNYNSNHIEGNTLTYGQTELLLMFDKTTGDHDMREFEEMKAHDAIVHLVRDYAADRTRELSETDIRQWNKTILVRPFWANAQTADKQPTRKLITPGEYKKEPNSVLLSNGEMFHYASPEETSIKMQELMTWYRKVSEDRNFHPVEIAALFHYKFVCIHPFDDCNGRTSRLLMNYVLFRNNYPPVIIKSADKKNYLNALNKADVGDINSFIQYIAEQLIWSLKMSIEAGKGGSIEEEDDLDKEIEILKREKSRDLHKSTTKSIDVLSDFITKSFLPLFDLLIQKHEKLNEFFITNNFSIREDTEGTLNHFLSNNEIVKEVDQMSMILSSFLSDYKSVSDFVLRKNIWHLEFYHGNLKTSPYQNTSINKEILIIFHPLRYEIVYNDDVIKKPYYEQLNKDEMISIVNLTVREVMERVKS